MIVHPRFDYVAADTSQEGPWQDQVKAADAVVNLADVSIFGLRTEGRKQQMVDSRILTTRHLVRAMTSRKPKVLCSASADWVKLRRSRWVWKPTRSLASSASRI